MLIEAHPRMPVTRVWTEVKKIIFHYSKIRTILGVPVNGPSFYFKDAIAKQLLAQHISIINAYLNEETDILISKSSDEIVIQAIRK